jgi:hypothetical protein
MNRHLLFNALVVLAVIALSAVFLVAQAGEGNVKAEIALMDTNHDGRVSPAEHAAGARRMFEQMDSDHDGRVTAIEMDAYKATMKKDDRQSSGDSKGEKSSAEKIKVIDTNGDSIISAAEHEAGSRSMFDKMDANHDGALTEDEIKAGHKAMMMKKDKEKEKPY